MKLDHLCAAFQSLAFPGASEREHPERPTVLAARELLAEAVADEDFLADCISREVELINQGALRRGLVPFYVQDPFGIRFAFGHWAPGEGPGPHEHTAWTITAVCRNELEVVTYDHVESYRQGRLVAKNRFRATAGKVGFIYHHGIHAPINPSEQWSLSLHVTSPLDGQRPDGFEEPLGALSPPWPLSETDVTHPTYSVARARQRARHIQNVTAALRGMTAAAVPHLLERCAEISPVAFRSISGSKPDEAPPGRAPRVLCKVHEGLELRWRRHGGAVVLQARSPFGFVDAVAFEDVAPEAIAYVASHDEFDVGMISDKLSMDERGALADALELAGLFVTSER